MSAIHDLIGQIGDARLRERLAAEWKAASTGKKFGLVFEDHLPELLPLPKAKPRRGDLVCRRQGLLKDAWQVKSVRDGVLTCVKPQDEAHPSEPTRATAETVNFAVDEVMVVREFGEPIFPSLVPVDAVADSPRPQAGEGPGGEGRALAYADRSRQLPCAATAGLPLRRQGGLHLHRPALQHRRA